MAAKVRNSPSLHPEITKPLVPPPNWDELAKLVSERLTRGFTRADISAAMAKDYVLVGRLERGAMPITKRTIEAYRSALSRLVAARAAQSGGAA